MSTHQKLSKYSGNLQGAVSYNGLEYDWEVPDEQIIGTPGGASTIHHHYTKGFDGRGNTSSDIYAGQGQRYNSGIYGGLYNQGDESSQQYYRPPPDYKYWENKEIIPEQSAPFPNKENFTGFDDFELIDNGSSTPVDNQNSEYRGTWGNILIILFFSFAFFVFTLWSGTGEKFLSSLFHKGKEIPLNYRLFYSLLFTLILFFVLWISKININLG